MSSTDNEAFDDLNSIETATSLKLYSEHLPHLRSASKGLEELRILQLGHDYTPISLAPLQFCPNVRDLYISAPVCEIETIGVLSRLERLHLWDVKLPRTSFMRALPRLTSLNITSCSVKSLDDLGALESLTHLTLRGLRSITSLRFLETLPNLRYLYLEALPKVLSLDDVARAPALEGLALESMNKLQCFTPLMQMRFLREFYLGNVRSRHPEEFYFLLSHQSLKRVGIFLGSDKKNNTLRDRFSARGIEFTKCAW